MIVMKRVYRYLQVTKDLKIFYQSGLTENLRLKIFPDECWTSDKEKQKSTSGYVALLAGCLISWIS